MKTTQTNQIGVFSSEPNVCWMLRMLGRLENIEATFLSYAQLSKEGSSAYAILILDLDELKFENVQLLLGEIRRRFPQTCLFVITSTAALTDTLSRLALDRVFLKPVLLEELYQAILAKLALPKSRGESAKRRAGKKASQENPDRIPRAKILVVDDEPEVCEFVKDALAEAQGDFRVAFAQNPETALKICAEFEPDIVIVDLKLPQMTGVELISRMQRLSAAGLKGCLFFTGTDDRARLGELETLGYPVLKKPCDMEVLVVALSKICQNLGLMKRGSGDQK
ncbi:MAG: response regulator [Candidatus Omnitrophica bacterium]|nr:response regulator [Candidatus Omnitrophota bacterium]